MAEFSFHRSQKIRSEMVVGLGTHSYGGLIRAQTKNFAQFSLMGSGQFAMELLPWICSRETVRLFCRTPEKLSLEEEKFKKIQVRNYQNADHLGEVLIIAAPLEDAELLNLIANHGSGLRKIFDLRGENNQLKSKLEQNLSSAFPEGRFQFVALADLFAELDQSRKGNESKVLQIKQAISRRVDQFMERSELRPMGWDDLCA